MKGIFQLRMPTPKYLVTWNLSVVLGYLKTLSPRNSLSLKQSTLKLAMLMALISFNRCDSLHKLDLRFHYFKHDGVNFIIPTHTKTSSATKFKEIFFPAFPQDRRLCIINYLKHYKEYTAEYQLKQSPSTPDPLFCQLCHLTSLSHLPHSQGGLKQYLTHSVRDAHLCARSPPPPFDEMRIYTHRNCHDCTPRCAFERIFLLVNLNENRWTIG